MAKANTWIYTTHGLKAVAILALCFITFFVFAGTSLFLAQKGWQLWPGCNCHGLQAVDKGQQTTGLAKNREAEEIKGFYGIKEA